MRTSNKYMANARRPSVGRAPVCTHVVFTRKFTTSEDEVCDLCHQLPWLGFLYRCTQDFNGFLPTSGVDEDADVPHFESDAQLHTLSNPVLAAAQKGHYTDEELSTLCKQKSRVRDAVRQARPYPPSSTSSTVSSSRNSLTTSSTFSTVQSFDSDTGSDLDFSHLSDQPFSCRTVLDPIHEVSDETTEEELELPNLFPPALEYPRTVICHHKVCPRCQPSYKERSWQSIDQVMLSGRPPPKHELDNKRLSSANLLKALDYNPLGTSSSKPAGSEVNTNAQETDFSARSKSVRSMHEVSTCRNFAVLVAKSAKQAVDSQQCYGSDAN